MLQRQVAKLTRQNRQLLDIVERLADRAGVGRDELDRMLINGDPGITTEVRQLVAEEKIIQAIKVYREATGAGLREAKETVEKYRDRYL